MRNVYNIYYTHEVLVQTLRSIVFRQQHSRSRQAETDDDDDDDDDGG